MKLIVPIYSMRSHETGKYSLLKDGNLQLHLNRHTDGDIIVVPPQDKCEDLSELRKYFPEIQFISVNYSENAYKTRKDFWAYSTFVIDGLIEYYGCDALVTDITGYSGNNKVYFNFNITKDPEVERSYIDEFIYTDVESVNKSVFTTVLNECQKQTLVDYGADPDKIYVNQRVVKPGVPERFLDGHEPIKINEVFFPFRLSDPCYKFDKVYNELINNTNEMFSIDTSNMKFFRITDPNDTWDKEKYPQCVLSKYTKQEYYAVLKGRPLIMYEEDPQKVFHPGLGELIYFGCVFRTPYKLPKIEDIIVNEPIWY